MLIERYNVKQANKKPLVSDIPSPKTGIPPPRIRHTYYIEQDNIQCRTTEKAALDATNIQSGRR